ncbi:hypothetical protein BKA80DRAFT_258288 [Phyllosticta citrichinensis]
MNLLSMSLLRLNFRQRISGELSLGDTNDSCVKDEVRHEETSIILSVVFIKNSVSEEVVQEAETTIPEAFARGGPPETGLDARLQDFTLNRRAARRYQAESWPRAQKRATESKTPGNAVGEVVTAATEVSCLEDAADWAQAASWGGARHFHQERISQEAQHDRERTKDAQSAE